MAVEGDSERRSIDTFCDSIYRDVAARYDADPLRIGDKALGYKVLYGPPISKAPIAFLGYQPGGGEEALGKESATPECWPPKCEYATESWRLAKKLQKVWSKELLQECVGLNINFFRSPSRHIWQKVSKEQRYPAEQFCIWKARALLDILKPKIVVIIGLTTTDDFQRGKAEWRTEKRVLARRGSLWGHDAYAIAHPTGARLSNRDLCVLQSLFSSLSAD